MIGASQALKDRHVKLQLQLADADTRVHEESIRAASFWDKLQRSQAEVQRLRKQLLVAKEGSRGGSKLSLLGTGKDDRSPGPSTQASSYALIRSAAETDTQPPPSGLALATRASLRSHRDSLVLQLDELPPIVGSPSRVATMTNLYAKLHEAGTSPDNQPAPIHATGAHVTSRPSGEPWQVVKVRRRAASQLPAQVNASFV
jgi:hypothetical protein